MGRLARWRGVVGLGVRTAVDRVLDGDQSALSVVGVAVAVGLMLCVTSLGIGIATGGVAADQSTDYLIQPAGEAGSVVANVGGQQLGQVHAATGRIEAMDGVDWATPLLVTLGSVEVGESRKQVFIFGVIAGPETRVAGLSTGALSAGDPMYDGGKRTGEAVISAAAAEEFGYGPGDTVSFASGATDAPSTFQVTGIADPSSPGLGQFPVVVVHLSELQAMTGGTDGDVATQILVSTSGTDVEPQLASVYPQSEVLTRGELIRSKALDSRLTLAVSVGAFLVAVVVGVLFIATTMGFELAAERETRAVLRAVGISRRSQLALVATRTVVICVLGGVGGVLLWLAVSLLVNASAATLTGGHAVAVIHPALALVGVGAALLIGLVTAPYLLLVSRPPAEELAP